MSNSETAKNELDFLFRDKGVTVVADGQYGSTGKGVIAAALAEWFHDRVDYVLSNAGPNSGHTSYYGNRRIILKQLPTFGVTAHLMREQQRRDAPAATPIKVPSIMLTGGAVIDRAILANEMDEYDISNVTVHPFASVIDADTKDADLRNVRQVASTGQGVGPSMQRKLDRVPEAVFGATVGLKRKYPPSCRNLRNDTLFMEVSQGFSLGLNSGFYPHVTTRECSVTQAMADAGLPPTLFRDSILSVRTFPIRVGNTENSSGPCYGDQEEISWDQLGVTPEMTTVTKRVRRVFTWSNIQFMDAVFTNAPSVIFLNFCNYLKPEDVDPFVETNLVFPYYKVMNRTPVVLLGFGPKTSDIRVWRGPGAISALALRHMNSRSGGV